MHDPNCIFCKIIAGQIPCFKLYEDADTLSFMDINPLNDGHCLVIAKAHHPDLFDLPADHMAAVARTVHKVARAVRDELQPEGMNLLQANGKAAAQSVLHFHMHIVPRKSNDGANLNWIPKPGDMAAIGKLAEKIKARL